MDDFNLAHGVAVWALSAPIGSQVPYHLDYAEQVRYESNIIVPPVLAGTLQCSPIHSSSNDTTMIGGDFVVYAKNDGLQHYQTFGYKGMKKTLLPEFNSIPINNDTVDVDDSDSSQQQHWMRIPYRYNRMIIQAYVCVFRISSYHGLYIFH
jgi:hypothetical protein